MKHFGIIDISGKCLEYYRIQVEGDSPVILEEKRDTVGWGPGLPEKGFFHTHFRRFFKNKIFSDLVAVCIPKTASINLTLEIKPTHRSLWLQQRIAQQLKQNFGIAIEEFVWRFYPLSFEKEVEKYAVALISKKNMKVLRQLFSPFDHQFKSLLVFFPFTHLSFLEKISLIKQSFFAGTTKHMLLYEGKLSKLPLNKILTGLCLTFIGLFWLSGWCSHKKQLVIKELNRAHSNIQSLEYYQNECRKLQNDIFLFKSFNDLKQRWVRLFSALEQVFKGFDYPIWLDNLKLSIHNENFSARKVGEFLFDTSLSVVEQERLPTFRKVIKMQGKVLHTSLNARDLQGHFTECLNKAKKFNKEQVITIMNMDIRTPKTPRSAETDFVCSLMLEPEDYL